MNIEWEFTNNDDMKMRPCMRLRGPQGKQGEQGIQGIQGEKGDTGSQGIQGETGKGLEYNWSGTQLGVRVEGDSTYTYTDLQGEKGDTGDTGATGAAAGFGTPTASITGTTGTPGVTVTASGPDTEKVFAFTFSNLKGDKGDTGNTGAAAGFGTPTASVDGTTGTPAVSVTASGSDTEKVFAFEFSGLKGETGQTGQTGATGADGVSPEVTVTTIAGGHRVTITDADHPSGQTFDVMDGSGSGDMRASAYDPQSAVATAGGIPDYVAAQGFASAGDLSAHTGDTNNPHSVTAAQVGLGNVPNVATNDQTPTYTVASANAELVSGETLTTAFGKIAKAIKSFIAHLSAINPHGITTSTLGFTHSALEIDDGATRAGTVSNRNLLDNPWFTVNQRGATTITSGYGADRWHFDGGTSLGFSSSGVTLTAAQMGQVVESVPNGTYTLSVKLSTGTIYSGTFNKQDDVTDVGIINNADITCGYVALYKNFWFNNSGKTSPLTIRAVKLELGSVSTLANDVAPNYDIELHKCKAYFRRLRGNNYYSLNGFASSSTQADFLNPFGTQPFAKTPVITITGTHTVRNANANYTVSSMTVQENAEHIVTGIRMTTNATNMTGYTMALYTSDTNSYIDISADL